MHNPKSQRPVLWSVAVISMVILSSTHALADHKIPTFPTVKYAYAQAYLFNANPGEGRPTSMVKRAGQAPQLTRAQS